MISLWVVIGLIVSTVCVSILGAAFSVVGLGALFSGAMIAVWAMASSLEFSKFVLAAYLHQRWKHLNIVFKSYLVFAVVVLSLITSMGIFGFLSDAYQSSSSAIEEVNIKIANSKSQQNLNRDEINRLNRSIDEIPATRISRKLKARAAAEPLMKQLTQKNDEIEKEIGQANLQLHEIRKKIGPLIYIARALNKDADTIVKYLILVFVSVFDPLAICLVIAMSEAMQARRQQKFQQKMQIMYENTHPAPSPVVTAEQVPESAPVAAAVETPPSKDLSFLNPDDEVIEMKYVEEKPEKKTS